MRPFEYLSPRSLNEALYLLASLETKPQVLAGGTDLMLQMKAGEVEPGALLSIRRVPELSGIQYESGTGLRLGATTTLRELTRSPIVRERYPCLAEAASHMASEQIRSFATLGGNLCNAAPSADLAPPLMVLGGEACVVDLEGESRVPVEDFFVGPGETIMGPTQILKEIRVPPPEGRSTYRRHTPRAFMDIAVVGVAARLDLQNGRVESAGIALAAVGPTPIRARRAEAALRGERFGSALARRASQIAAEETSPIDDVRASAWYRRRMVEVLTFRALEALYASASVEV